MLVFDHTVDWPADRVQRFDEVTVLGRVELLKHRGSYPSHDAHRAHDVRRVRELDADFRVRRVQRSHAERYHVHGPAFHTPREPFTDRLVRVRWAHPVPHYSLGRSPGHVHRVPHIRRAYVRPALHPGHVLGTAPCQKAKISSTTRLTFIRFMSQCCDHWMPFNITSYEKKIHMHLSQEYSTRFTRTHTV